MKGPWKPPALLIIFNLLSMLLTFLLKQYGSGALSPSTGQRPLLNLYQIEPHMCNNPNEQKIAPTHLILIFHGQLVELWRLCNAAGF